MTGTRTATWLVTGIALVVGLATATGRAQLLPTVAGPAISPERLELAAAGHHTAVVTVARAGRYAIEAHSTTGVSLQLDDQMTGPGEVIGVVGERDGRLDVLLEAGEYRLTITGDARAAGDAVVTLAPYREVNSAPAPQLVELKSVASTLGDREQRSWWLDVASRRWIHLEAGGRALGDLRLWLDGSWLVAAEPAREVVEPVAGRPLRVCRLATLLEPGLYLVTAAGGAPLAWADDDGAMPLHLRAGIPSLGAADRRRHVAGPLGVDRWRVPGSTTYLRLELPAAIPAELGYATWSPADGFAAPDEATAVSRESRTPVAELWPPEHDGEDVVTVRLAAGEPYLLQHFRAEREARIDDSGTFWVASVHSGAPADSVPATGILVDNSSQHVVVASQTIAVGRDRGWRGRANLLAPLSVFLSVADAGSYRVDATGIAARVRLQPFLVAPPRGYRTPPFRAAASTWSLDPGLWVLEAEPEPEAVGIVELTVRPEGGDLENLVIDDRPGPGAVAMPRVALSANRWGYTLYLNDQPGVVVGPVVRPLPLRLDLDPLPLTLAPGASVEVRLQVGEAARLEAVAEDGSRLELVVDGGPGEASQEVAAGVHAVEVRNPGDRIVVASLAALPLRLQASTALPPLPAGRLAALPAFPRLAPGEPYTFDLAREQQMTFAITAPSAALYRLETTGLLDTEGTLRARVATDLGRADDGGSGRNLLLHRFLAAGDYQLTVAARGSSAGHLGLVLARTEPRAGGLLSPGRAARASLAAGEAIAYRVSIVAAGRYRLRSLALGRTPRCRLDDAAGWPLVRPAVPADLELQLEPGEYRLLLLPEPVAGRRVTFLEPLPEPVERVGHGPHQLPLDEAVSHRWLEPAAGGERDPDVWQFDLAAATTVTVGLAAGMVAHLSDAAEPGTVLATASEGRGWSGSLTAGAYRLEVAAARPDNRREYTIRVTPAALLPGMARPVALPATVPVAFGAGPVEITTLGEVDVAARLVAPDGRVLARADDRPDDWNVLLAGRFPSGPASLELIPVGVAEGATTVAMTVRPEVANPARSLPLRCALAGGDAIQVVPLAATDAAGVLLASAHGAAAVGLALELADGDGWRVAGQEIGLDATLAVPLAAGTTARLRVWSADRGGGAIDVVALIAKPARVGERDAGRGFALGPVAGFEPPTAVVALDLDRPGTLRLAAPVKATWTADIGTALTPVRDGLLAAPAAHGWLAVPLAGAPARLAAPRVTLAAGDRQRLRLAAGAWSTVDIAGGGGDLVVACARAMGGQPVVAVDDGGETSDAAAIALGAHAALAAGRGDAAAIRLTLAGAPGDEADTRLEVLEFALPPAVAAGAGRHAGIATPTLLALPPPPSELRLTLAAGLAAVVLAGDRPVAVAWADGAAAVERLVATGDRLAVLPIGAAAGEWAAEIAPFATSLTVAAGEPFERVEAAAGRLRLTVAGGAPADLLVHAEGVDEARFLAADGRVAQGRAIVTGGRPGTLWLDHGPGPVTVWFGPASEPARGLWQAVAVPPAEVAQVPFAAALVQGVAAWAVELTRPSLLTVTAPAAAAVRVCAAGACRSWLGDGLPHHLPADRGSVEIAVRDATGGRLAVAAAPIEEIGEGLGSARVLAAGDALAFRFTVAAAGRIGVGVRSDPDTVACRLLDAGGGELGSGVIQLHELTAGDYLLLVSQPAAAGVSRIRPAVVGLAPPATGPPDDVIRSYLALERSTP